MWNAWILVIPMLIIFFFDVKVTIARESGDFQLTRKEKRILNAIPLTMFISFFYAVFLPLQLGATWLYSGILIYLFGMVFTIVAVLNACICISSASLFYGSHFSAISFTLHYAFQQSYMLISCRQH